MRRSLLPIAASALFASVSANAQTQEQKNVMQHVGVLFIADKWCTDYSVNLLSITSAAREAKIVADRQPFTAYIKQQMDKAQEALSDAGTREGCSVIYSLYGPKGSAVPGQMMRK